MNMNIKERKTDFLNIKNKSLFHLVSSGLYLNKILILI